MARKNEQKEKLYFADQVGIGTLNTAGELEIMDSFPTEKTAEDKKKNPCRFSMAVSAEKAASNIKYKTAVKIIGRNKENEIKAYIKMLEVHFAPYPGTDAMPEDAVEYNKNQSATAQKEEEEIMEKNIGKTEKGFEICWEEDEPILRDHATTVEYSILSEIVSKFDTYRFIRLNRETISHDGPEDMGEEWDSDKESRSMLDFTVGSKNYRLTVSCSENGYFTGAWLENDDYELQLPYGGYALADNTVKTPMVLKEYLKELVEYLDKNIGTKELVRRQNCLDVINSDLVKEKDFEERNAYKCILFDLKDAGFNVAITNIDPDIKGAHIALLCEDNIAPMITFDIKNLKAIEFGRELYRFLFLNIKTKESQTVQKQLIKRFGGKQKTMVQPQADTVDNKTAPAKENKAGNVIKKEEKMLEKEVVSYEDAIRDAYADLAAEDPSINCHGIPISFTILQGGKQVTVSRSFTIKTGVIGESDFFLGYVYNGKDFVGSWQWNLKYYHPQFGPAGRKDDAGKQIWLCYSSHNNTGRLIIAIEKALNKKGIATNQRAAREAKIMGYNDAPVVDYSKRKSVTGTAKMESVFPGLAEGEDAV